jgi:Domain of unknown function (DUF4265)
MSDYYKQGYCHIIFPLKRDSDGYPDASAERLWAKKIAPNQFQIQNIPFYIKGVSLKDIVEARNVSEDVYEFVKILKYSGHSTFRIFISGDVTDNDKVLQATVQRLNSMGCKTEGLNKDSTLTAIDVPPKTDINKIGQFLRDQYKLGLLDFEEASVPDDYISQK